MPDRLKQIVPGEPSLGTPHPRGSDPTAWDVGPLAAITYTMAAPYTWDLSGVLPVGTKAIDIMLLIQRVTTADTSAGKLFCWQYELGAPAAAFSTFGPKGLCVRVSKMVASNFAYDEIEAEKEGKILLGPSRKLYLGFEADAGHSGYAMWKFYDS